MKSNAIYVGIFLLTLVLCIECLSCKQSFSQPSVTADNALDIVYSITAPNGSAQIFTMNSDGSVMRQLTNRSGRFYGSAFSPDATQIIFYNHLNNNTWLLYLMNADGSKIHQLTTGDNRYDWSPDWSPDGSRIVFARSFTTPIWRSEIWEVKPDGSDLRQLGNVNGQGPDWSPCGAKIVYFNYEEEGGDIWVMHADGTNPVKLTDHSAEDWWPKWSPNGWEQSDSDH